MKKKNCFKEFKEKKFFLFSKKILLKNFLHLKIKRKN